MPTTVGFEMLRQALPDDIELKGRTLDKKGVTELLTELEEKHPDKYRDVLKAMVDIGGQSTYTTGASVSLRHLLPSKAKKQLTQRLRSRIAQIHALNIDDEKKDQMIIKAAGPYIDQIRDAVYKEQLDADSPFAEQVKSGAKGKPAQLSAIVGSEVLYDDHNNETIPVPVFSNYAEGLDPVEYWAANYGGRRGLVDVKYATADAGFFGKRLVNAAHRQMVTDEKPLESRLPTGIPTTAEDHDNVGAVLSAPVAGYNAGTVITPSILKDIKRKAPGKRFLVHSPLTSRTENGGIDRLSAGIREKRDLASVGDNIGIPAAQAVAERVSQGSLESKHAGGAAKTDSLSRSGFQYLNRLVEAPKEFEEAGRVSPVDGRVHAVDEAPQGGWFVSVGDDRVYIPANRKVQVRPGQELEAGDMLTDGIPHPGDLVRHHGIGEARRQYTDLLMEGMSNSGIPAHRRNVEALVAGIINHVQVTDVNGVGNYTVDDVVPYSALFGRGYQPRVGNRTVPVGKARGTYLEEPVLHYTPGTRVTNRVLKDLKEFGVKDLNVHDDEPGFQPQMVRGMMNLYHDPDWQTQLGGFYTGKAFLESARRGATSQQRGSTSFYGALSKGDTFGKDLETKGTF